MKYFAIALASAALAGAQTPGISIRATTAGLGLRSGGPGSGPAMGAAPRMSAPVLGYIVGPGPLDLRVIAGTAKTAQIGGRVAVPVGAKHLFVPPREHYLLLESSAAEPLALWLPTKSDAERTPLPGAMAHPDNVSFSARGDSMALYAKGGDRLQIVTGLPAEPTVAAHSGIGKLGEVAVFAVSDDGSVLVASLLDGTAIISLRGAEWQRLPAAYGARAILFVPRTQNLVVSDSAQQTVTLVSNVGETSQATRVLAHNVAAERLAFTKEGTVLLAASLSQSKVWTFDLKAMTPGSVSSSSVDTLLPLRDGHTFLLSAAGFSLFNVPVDGESATGFASVTR